MGKNKNSKNKLYYTNHELSMLKPANKKDILFRKLDFRTCSLSLKYYKKPVCTVDGDIFDKEIIENFIDKYGINPLTKVKLNKNDLIDLKFHKNNKNECICPISKKVFNEFSDICCIKNDGCVYDTNTIKDIYIINDELNNPLTDEKLSKDNLIKLQNKNTTKIIKPKASEINLNKRENFKLEIQNINKKPNLDENKSISTIEEFLDERILLQDWFNDKISSGNSGNSLISTYYDSGNSNKFKVYNIIEMLDIIGYQLKSKSLVTKTILTTSIGEFKLNLFSNKNPKSVYSILKIINNINGMNFNKIINNCMIVSNNQDYSNIKLEMMDKSDKLLHNKEGLLTISNFGTLNTLGFTFKECSDFDDLNVILGEILDFNKIYDHMFYKNYHNEIFKIINIKVIDNPYNKVALELRKEIINKNKKNNFYNLIKKEIKKPTKLDNNNSLTSQLFGY